MKDHRNTIGVEFDRMLAPTRIPWAKIIVILCAAYIAGHLIRWAWRGLDIFR